MINQNQKGIASLLAIIIVIGIAVVAIGGVLAYQYWWAPEEEVEEKEEMPRDETADWEVYTTSPDRAPYGNYRFKYPSELLIKDDYVYTTPTGVKGPHTVILERVAEQNIPPGTLNLNRIEINVIRTPCEYYKHCIEVENIPIGTNSEDVTFLEIFNIFVENFEVL